MAWRSLRRAPRRSLAVIALLALPVAAATVASAGQRALFPSEAAQQEWYRGQSDWVVNLSSPVPLGPAANTVDVEQLASDTGLDEASLEALVAWSAAADLSSLVEVVQRALPGAALARVELSGFGLGNDHVELRAMNAADPLTRGMIILDSGGAPTSRREASLTAGLAERLDAGVGDRIDVPGLGEVKVVGIHRLASDARALGVLVPEGGLGLGPSGSAMLLVGGVGSLDQQLDAALRAELGPELAGVLTRLGAITATPSTLRFGTVGGGLLQLDRPPVLAGFVSVAVLAVVGLVTAAAFATSTRRRIREFGLLATIGGEPGHLRSQVVREAALLGMVGVCVGVATGFLASEALTGVVGTFATHVVDDLPIRLADVVLPSLVALGGAMTAAWFPARAAARVPALGALAGRMPTRRLRATILPVAALLTGLGLLVVGAGAASQRGSYQATDAAVAIILGGCLVCLAGVALGATWLVGWLGSHADRLPMLARLVARDAARQQFRSSAAVAALVVILAVPILVAVAAASTEADAAANHLPAALEDEIFVSRWTENGRPAPLTDSETEALAAAVPLAQVGTVTELGVTDPATAELMRVAATPQTIARVGPNPTIALGDDEAVRALRLTAQTAELLTEGRLVAVGGPGGPVVIGYTDRAGDWHETMLEAVAVEDRPLTWAAPGYLVPPRLVGELGLSPVAAQMVLVAERPLSDAQRLLIHGAAADLSREGQTIAVVIGDRFEPYARRVQLIVLPISAIMVLLVGSALVAVAATESDETVSTMVRVGATPGLRRRFLGLQSWYHAFVAALLAVPIGVLLLVALRQAVVDQPPVVVPWLTLLTVVLALPALLGSVVALTVRGRVRVAARAWGQ